MKMSPCQSLCKSISGPTAANIMPEAAAAALWTRL